MINVAEYKMMISLMERQILDMQAKCEHKNYRADPVVGGLYKCMCNECQTSWYIEASGGS